MQLVFGSMVHALPSLQPLGLSSWLKRINSFLPNALLMIAVVFSREAYEGIYPSISRLSQQFCQPIAREEHFSEVSLHESTCSETKTSLIEQQLTVFIQKSGYNSTFPWHISQPFIANTT